MTRISKFWTREMLTQQLNEGWMREIDDDVSFSRSRDLDISTKSMVVKRTKREESGDKKGKKKAKLEWRPEDSAKSIGKLVRCTGVGEKMKYHYENFEFHGIRYGLEDTVLLAPEYVNQKNYIAIIKDIFVKEKDGVVMLEVQWFYRREDIEIKHAGKWVSEDSCKIFYSFHCDEVFAESVKRKCLVYFVPDEKEISRALQHSDFIVQKVYDIINKKLRKFSSLSFDVDQKFEIDILVAKTFSRIGDLPDIKKGKMSKIPRRKRSVRKKCVLNAEIRDSNNIIEVNMSGYKLPASDLDRGKSLVELLKALIAHVCCASNEKQVGDPGFMPPDNVTLMVFDLEEALYDSFADDIPKYNSKLELLVEKLKDARVLARRLLNGELKPEQVIKMKGYELIM
ncbi:hypothetical protein CARUB_v10018565mg, partial [Capsella rubella]